MQIVLLSLTLYVLSSAEIEEYKMTNGECREAGFIPESLKCTLCDELRHFNLEILISDCMSCCTKDQEDEHEKYPFAHIEVCECNLGRFPQVQAFVRENMASQWGSRVRVRHIRGVRPQIVLKDNSGNTRQTMNIEKWDTDTITDFLNEWIQ